MRHVASIGFGLAALASAACSEIPSSPERSFDAPELRLAHESNNRAQLTGMQDGNTITGTAIINYVAGTEGWQSSVNLQGELAPGTYTFFAIGPGGVQPVCSFTVVTSDDRQGCSADTDLGGFGRAEVRDSAGNVVASGMFERRGGKREK